MDGNSKRNIGGGYWSGGFSKGGIQMKFLRVIGTFLAGKQYLIHAIGMGNEEANKLEMKLNKQKFTIVTSEVEVEEL